MTRDEHLEYAKKRALEYIDKGDFKMAYPSIVSDLSRCPELKDHSHIKMGIMMLMNGLLDSAESMRVFIEGFR